MKYELTSESIIVDGHTLYRIRATKNFTNVKKGNLGGFIEKVENLSQEGNCWVYNNAMIYGDAKAFDNSKIFDNSRVFDNAWIYGDAKANGMAIIYGNSRINGVNGVWYCY